MQCNLHSSASESLGGFIGSTRPPFAAGVLILQSIHERLPRATYPSSLCDVLPQADCQENQH